MKILVTDDSRVMRQIVIRTLRQAGFDDHDIIEAEDGAQCLDKVGAEALTESVLMTRPPTVVDQEDVEDALGELANVLGGNIKSALPSLPVNHHPHHDNGVSL